MMSPAEKFGFHRWLVREMREQIFAKPVAVNDPSINGWANVLSQNGSIEGVYHGLILSTEYTELEKGKADLKAIRFFGSAMTLVENPSLAENDAKLQASSAAYVKDNMSAPLFTLKRLLGEKVLGEVEKRKADKEKLAAWYADLATRWARLDIPFGLPQRNQAEEVFHLKWARGNSLGLLQWELLNRIHRAMNFYGGVPVASVPPVAPAPAAAKAQK
jgi:hypothetical protein